MCPTRSARSLCAPTNAGSLARHSAGSAPTLRGRFAAWLGRSTAAITLPAVLRQEIYVDDPIHVVAGSPDMQVQELALALLWASVA
eukprot:3631291-Lingulodinium_polyedra.AAC.1